MKKINFHPPTPIFFEQTVVIENRYHMNQFIKRLHTLLVLKVAATRGIMNGVNVELNESREARINKIIAHTNKIINL